MNDKRAVICPHCGKEVDGEWQAIGNYFFADGWTPEIVARAARETGFTLEARKPILGGDPDEKLSIWCKGAQGDLAAFWDRAEKLRAEASD